MIQRVFITGSAGFIGANTLATYVFLNAPRPRVFPRSAQAI